MNNLDMVIIAVLAILGSLAATTITYLTSPDPFDPKKFGASALRGVIAAVALAVVSLINPNAPATALNYFSAFLAGAGVDVFGSRTSALYQMRQMRKK